MIQLKGHRNVSFFMSARQKPKRVRPAFLPHPPAGRKPNPAEFQKNQSRFCESSLPQNSFAKPSPFSVVRIFRIAFKKGSNFVQ
jgi:hypothetical protein